MKRNEKVGARAAQGALVALWAVLAVALAAVLGVAQPVLAAPGTGTLTVTARDEAHTYTAWRLFSGTVSDPAEGETEPTVADVSWDDCMPAAFYQAVGSYENAEDAAIAIATKARADATGAYVAQLSRLAVAYPDSAVATFSTGETVTLSSGWYLLTSEDGQPVLVAVGASPATVYEKSTPPGLTKKVGVTDAAGNVAWADEATYGLGDDIPYRIEGTLPLNYAAFETYSYVFHDQLSQGLTADVSTVAVTLVHADGTTEDVPADAYAASFEGQELTVSFADLKTAVPAAAYGDTLRVSYVSHLVPGEAKLGFDEGNPNDAWLEYTRSPTYDATGDTPHSKPVVYTFSLLVEKRDASSHKALAGARFALRRADGSYLAADGTWVSDASAAAQATGDDGSLAFAGLAPGDYVLVEVEAPKGYQKVDDVTVHVAADLAARSLTLTAESSSASVASVDAATGVTTLVVNDQPVPTPGRTPVTGDASIAVGGIVVAALVVLVVALVLRRRGDKDGRDSATHQG